jgi:hypothetical protein
MLPHLLPSLSLHAYKLLFNNIKKGSKPQISFFSFLCIALQLGDDLVPLPGCLLFELLDERSVLGLDEQLSTYQFSTRRVFLGSSRLDWCRNRRTYRRNKRSARLRTDVDRFWSLTRWIGILLVELLLSYYRLRFLHLRQRRIWRINYL